MPSHWIYFLALALILILRVLVIDTTYFAEWVWYQYQNESAYHAVMAFRENPTVLQFIGGWPLPVFVITVYMYWITEFNGKNIKAQFMLLPLAYLPFSIIGSMLTDLTFDMSRLFSHPLVIIPSGYMYIFPWVVFVAVFVKLRLLVDDGA